MPVWYMRLTLVFGLAALVFGLVWMIVKHEILIGAIWFVIAGVYALGIWVYWQRHRRRST